MYDIIIRLSFCIAVMSSDDFNQFKTLAVNFNHYPFDYKFTQLIARTRSIRMINVPMVMFFILENQNYE